MGERPRPSLSFLSLEADGFGLVAGDEGVATWGDLVCCLAGVAAAPDVVAEGDPIIFDGEERGDFGNGELGPLEKVSREVESKRSLIGLMAQAFCLIPFGTGGGKGFMASDTTERATGGST